MWFIVEALCESVLMQCAITRALGFSLLVQHIRLSSCGVSTIARVACVSTIARVACVSTIARVACVSTIARVACVSTIARVACVSTIARVA